MIRLIGAGVKALSRATPVMHKTVDEQDGACRQRVSTWQASLGCKQKGYCSREGEDYLKSYRASIRPPRSRYSSVCKYDNDISIDIQYLLYL